MNALNDKNKIIIATDSSELKSHCESFGAITMLTSKDCLTGTDRVAEVSEKIDAEQYVNLQGDEPIFPFKELNNFILKANKNTNEVSTGIIKILKENDYRNSSIPKMVFFNSRKLLYSSRASIPHNKKSTFEEAYKHICVYAFNKSHLKAFKNQKNKTKFELQEDLEINRFLELDIIVRCIELKSSGKALDTKEDLEIIKNYIQFKK